MLINAHSIQLTDHSVHSKREQRCLEKMWELEYACSHLTYRQPSRLYCVHTKHELNGQVTDRVLRQSLEFIWGTLSWLCGFVQMAEQEPWVYPLTTTHPLMFSYSSHQRQLLFCRLYFTNGDWSLLVCCCMIYQIEPLCMYIAEIIVELRRQ